eukprot:TRINITY_DN15008_c0_g1_i3.p1 TRINITY_DN15008_c0_g1~~TRINITY_DN15008_c0_g1_i3.p1  ORF type:complete len:159 (+),score=20.10 TRINITY_DN15008_c0_g1_i3:67-477(+)
MIIVLVVVLNIGFKQRALTPKLPIITQHTISTHGRKITPKSRNPKIILHKRHKNPTKQLIFPPYPPAQDTTRSNPDSTITAVPSTKLQKKSLTLDDGKSPFFGICGNPNPRKRERERKGKIYEGKEAGGEEHEAVK